MSDKKDNERIKVDEPKQPKNPFPDDSEDVQTFSEGSDRIQTTEL